MAPKLADLLTIPTQQEILEGEVLPVLKTRGLKVNDWKASAVNRAYAFISSIMRLDVRIAVAALCAAGFEDYVFGLVDVPGGIDVTDWAPTVAKQRYGLDRIAATSTIRRFTITNAIATPYDDVEPGDIVVLVDETKNRYVLDEPVDIPASGSITALFRSERVNDSAAGDLYNDPSDATLILVTANFPGVTITNPAPVFSIVAQSGSGEGTVTPGGSPSGNHHVVVRIDTTGLEGTCAWSTSIDGGAWVAQSGNSATNIGGVGINVALDDNGGNPSFIAGTRYYFSTPGSDVVEVGRDIETPQELGARCKARWPTLAFRVSADGQVVPISPTESGYAILAREASKQVKQVFLRLGTVNNEVIICVAGQGALLPGTEIAKVQTYLDSRAMLTDYPVVSSPVLRAILLGGATIVVQAGMKDVAQLAVQRALQLYFGAVDGANQLGPNGLIDHGYLVALIRRAPGVKRLTDGALLINGDDGDLQLPVTPGALEMAAWNQFASAAFTWLEE